MTKSADSFESPLQEALAGTLTRRERLKIMHDRAAAARTAAAPSSDDDLSVLADQFATGMGGLGDSTAVPVTHGECVIVLHEDVDNTSNCTLCGVEIGQTGKLCFKEGCSTHSHIQLRNSPQFSLKEGVYIRTGTTGASRRKVYKSPVGSLEVFNIHHEDILGITDTTPALWTSRFNTWARAKDPDEAADMFATKAAAKRLQTPAKPTAQRGDYSKFFQNIAPSELLGDSLVERMKMYDSLWRKSSAATGDAPLPDGFELGDYLIDNHRKLGQISECITAMAEDQNADRQWVGGELKGSALRITDLENIVGDPVGDSASVWTSISSLSSGLSQVEDKITTALNTKVAAIESELDAMITSMENLKAGLIAKTEEIGKRMDAFGTHRDEDKVSPAVEELFKSLSNDKESAQRRLDSIEARMEADHAKITLGREKLVLRSAVDLRIYLKSVTGGDLLRFGGFADVYTFLSRIHARQHNITMESMVKAQKDVKTLEISLSEAMVVHTHTQLVPAIFGTAKDNPSGSALSLLPTYKSWRDVEKFSGVAHVIEDSIISVADEIEQIITEDFANHPNLYELRDLARKISLHSQSFITALIRWVDDTYRHLIASGNEEKSVWWVITTVIKEIFRDYLAPARATPTDIDFEDGVHRCSSFIWGTLKTEVAATRMSTKGIRNHPTVVGAYAQWLVSNNGLKDALSARSEVKKLQSGIDALKGSISDHSKTVSDLKSKVESVKKTADKALTKATSGGSGN